MRVRFSKRFDITGRRFGRLVVIRRAESRRNRIYWLCRCDCGEDTHVRYTHLIRNATKSCGCGKVKHGMTQSREFGIWNGILSRCTNPRSANWKHYGARGICVCDAWRQSFTAFFKDVGPRPLGKYSIDRINNDGHYEPGNVRWTTGDVQARNRRKRPGRYITLDGECLTRPQIAERLALPWNVYRGFFYRKRVALSA